MLKIATILPYKENYSIKRAAAASLWVYDFFKHSKLKKNNYIFGSTEEKDYLSNNYINIKIKDLRSKLSSTTNQYCNELIKKINGKNFDSAYNRVISSVNYCWNNNKRYLLIITGKGKNSKENSETLREKEYLPKLQIKTNITTDDLTDQRINTPEMNLRKI